MVLDVVARFFEGRPDVPEHERVDLGQSQQRAIDDNMRSFGSASQLAGKYTDFNFGQIDQMQSRLNPDWLATSKQIGKNNLAASQGRINVDVQQAIQRNAAARALSGGFAGSSSHGNLVARDLGLTSLDLQESGQRRSESWASTMNSIYAPGRVAPQEFAVTPAQRQMADVEERNAKFQRDYVENQWEWYDSFGQQAVRATTIANANMMKMMEMSSSAGGSA
jgi:hypothetical protein